MTPRRLDAEGLQLGGGLEVLLAAALEGLAPGGRIEVVSPSRGTALELHGWARRIPHRPVAGWHARLFDIGGVVATAGLLLTFVISAISNTRELSRREPIR